MNYFFTTQQHLFSSITLSVHHTLISLHVRLSVTTVRVTSYKGITICSVCILPNYWCITSYVSTYTSLNSYHHNFSFDTLTGSASNNPRGDSIQIPLSKNILFVFDDKSPTLLHSGHGTFSLQDISISDTSLLLGFWMVCTLFETWHACQRSDKN